MATQSYHFVQEILPEVALDPVRLHSLMGALLADRGVTMLGALWEQAGAACGAAERQPPRDLAGELRRAGDLVVATVALPPPREPPAPCALAIVARATWATGPLPTAIFDPRYYVLEIGLDSKRGGPAFLFAETALATWRGPAPPDPVPVPPDLRVVGEAACAAYAVAGKLRVPPSEPGGLQLPPWYWLHVGGAREAIVEVIRAESSAAIAHVLTARPILLLPEIVGAIESMGAADADPRTADMFARVAQSVARIHELVREDADHPRQLLALALVLAREPHGVRRGNLERALPVVFEARQRMTPSAPQYVQTLAAEAFVRRGLADQGVYPVANLTQAAHVLGAAVDIAGSPTARQRLADELAAVRALLAMVEAALATAPAAKPTPVAPQATKTIRLKPPESRLGAYVIVREYTKAHDYASPALSRELEATLLDETIFGTDTSCTVEIKGAYISPQHCRIVREGDRFVLRDHSTNGTFVDGVGRVRERVLAPGDWIAVGLARIQFQIATPSRIAVAFEREPRLHMALPDEVPIGRHPENTIQILDRTVAKHHGRITREGDRHVYRDLGSMNGTRLRGVKIDEHLLEPGDELAIGGARLVYERGAGVETPMVSVSPRPGTSVAPPVPGVAPAANATLPIGSPPRASSPPAIPSAIPSAIPVESDPPTIPVPPRKPAAAAPVADPATLPLARKTPRPVGPVGPETLPLSRSTPVPRVKVHPPEPAAIATSRDTPPPLPALRPSASALPPPPLPPGTRTAPTPPALPSLRSSTPSSSPSLRPSAPSIPSLRPSSPSSPSLRPSTPSSSSSSLTPPSSSTPPSSPSPATTPTSPSPRPTTTEPDFEEARWLALFLDELDLAAYQRDHDARVQLVHDPVFAANRGWRAGHVSWRGEPAWPVGLAADHRWLFPSSGEASRFLASAVPLPHEGLLEIAPPPLDFDELRTFTGVRSAGAGAGAGVGAGAGAGAGGASGTGGAVGRIVCMLRVGRVVAKLEVVEGGQARAAGQALQPYHLLPFAERIVARARGVLGS